MSERIAHPEPPSVTAPRATTPSRAPAIVDVLVIGGGPAGLSAAVTLGRSLRSVTVIDGGAPRNAPASGAHNVLGREGIAPAELLRLGRAEAAAVGVSVLDEVAVSAERLPGPGRQGASEFQIRLESGATIQARRLLLATGLRDELPELPGLSRHWGSGVLHCPYCHGYEVRGQRIAVLGSGPLSAHQALLFRQLSEHVVLFTHGIPDLGSETAAELLAIGVRLDSARVTGVLASAAGGLAGVSLEDGRTAELDALCVAPRFLANGTLFEQLGGALEELPVGRAIPADPSGQTPVPGVWAAGNSSALGAMVQVSAGSGVTAAIGINAELAGIDAREALRGATTG